jgi:hypothetical protein
MATPLCFTPWSKAIIAGLPHMHPSVARTLCFALQSTASLTIQCGAPLITRWSSYHMHYVENCSTGEVTGRVLPASHTQRWEEEGQELSLIPPGPSAQAGSTHQVLTGCHPDVILSFSEIHGRGLRVTKPVPAGTPLIHFDQMYFVDPVQNMNFLGHHQIVQSGMPRYIQRCGGLTQFPLSPNALHLINHSCSPTLRCASTNPSATSWYNLVARPSLGKDSEAWKQAESLGTEQKRPLYLDANTFVSTRDLSVGEELTLDYKTQVSPMHRSEYIYVAPELRRCKCGASNCCGEIYPQEFLSQLDFVDSVSQLDPQFYSDETIMLALLKDRGELFRYLVNDHPVPVDPQLILFARKAVATNGSEAIVADAVKHASVRWSASEVVHQREESPSDATMPAPFISSKSFLSTAVTARRIRKRQLINEVKATYDSLRILLPNKGETPQKWSAKLSSV